MDKKTVGVLTLPLRNNYGGIIQLVALYQFLEKEGYHPIWIDKRQWNNRIKNSVIKWLENNPFYNIWDPKEFTRSKQFLKTIDPFLKQYLPERTPPIVNALTLENEARNIQSFIVGSDQVWRLEYVKDNYPSYFLDFVPEDKIKISYAASFGTDSWIGKPETTKAVGKELRRFHAISVREDTAVAICSDCFDLHSTLVLDPTFLVEVSFYAQMIQNKKCKEIKGIFNYVLDKTEKSEQLVNSIAKKQNFDIHKIYLKDYNSSKSLDLMENWLAHFYYADYIVTDSFHGMVFSLIFNKQFLVLGNKKRGLTRFTSLLKLLDLEERLIGTEEELQLESIEEINYKEVNKKINLLQGLSRNFLLSNLK